jgi:hypothetical protein
MNVFIYDDSLWAKSPMLNVNKCPNTSQKQAVKREKAVVAYPI